MDLSAGKDLALISSRITAGDEAYLVAGDNLELLAAQDSDYSLYDKKKKGSWGSKQTQRDEVTKVTHVGSEISTGGDLTLVSGGDQKYQAAKLESGSDLTLASGGEITFEGVKDLHQESHEKTNNNAAWVSSKGKGNTDETLRQTQMLAAGDVVIKAIDGLKIDVKQVDQQTVSQSIEAMVKADPQLAWLKQAEARGDVDWRQVKEIHESFKYSNSGLGPASQIIIAIVMAAVVGPAAAAMAGGGTVGAVAGAVAANASTNATVSVVNNRGNLGAVFKDVTSSDAMKGYVISGVTAGLTAAYFDGWTGTETNITTGKITPPSLSTWKGVGQFAASQSLQSGTSMLLSKALGQGGSASDALKNVLFNTLAAASFNAVGDYTKNILADGSLPKIAVHAMVGGLLSKATGGDFKTGALAAGANEALVVHLDKLVGGNENLLTMSSQIVGVLAAAGQTDADAAKMEKGSWVAKNATQYNFLNHQDVKDLEKALKDCQAKGSCDQVREEFRRRDATNSARLAACTTDCAAIRDELDAGSPALKQLWESDTTGVTDEFLRNNINEWSSAGPRVANQVAEAALRGDSTALLQLGQYLDQQGFNPFGINAAGLIGLSGGAKTGVNSEAGSTASTVRAFGDEIVGKIEAKLSEQVKGSKATSEVVPPAPVVSSGTTRTGVVRTNTADWRALRDNWDDLGYGQILSTENRVAIAKGRTPKVDDAWVKVFPEDAGLKGERIPMHHVQGSPLTVPLPDTRHLDAHMPGGFRYNPGGLGSALPAYPPKKGVE